MRIDAPALWMPIKTRLRLDRGARIQGLTVDAPASFSESADGSFFVHCVLQDLRGFCFGPRPFHKWSFPTEVRLLFYVGGP